MDEDGIAIFCLPCGLLRPHLNPLAAAVRSHKVSLEFCAPWAWRILQLHFCLKQLGCEQVSLALAADLIL